MRHPFKTALALLTMLAALPAWASSVTLTPGTPTLILSPGAGNTALQNQSTANVICWRRGSTGDPSAIPYDFAVAGLATFTVDGTQYVYCKGTAATPIGVNPFIGGSSGGGGGGSVSATATAASPTYIEGSTTAALSLDLSGYMRSRSIQDGSWSVGLTGTLPAFAATPTVNIGTAPTLAISNSAFGISGTLPAFATTPTVNIGAAPTITISNSAFGISGTLPAFAATPTVNTVVSATSTNRGAVIGFTGAVFSSTNASTTITVTTAPTAGTVQVGQVVTGTNINGNTTIASLGTGSGGTGTYVLSANATATASGNTLTSVGPQQIMASNSSRRGSAYQVQSNISTCYVNGTGTATADYNSLMLLPNSYYDSPPHHTGTGTVSVICTLAATPFYAREF